MLIYSTNYMCKVAGYMAFKCLCFSLSFDALKGYVGFMAYKFTIDANKYIWIFHGVKSSSI